MPTMSQAKPKTRKKGAKAPKAHSKSQALVSSAMREVHTNEPSTVTRANVSGEQKEKMLQAIALSKARKAGARIPKKRTTRKH